MSFLHVERSGALEARVREICTRLCRFNDRISQCEVAVVASQAPGSQALAVKIHLSVPGAQIHAEGCHSHEAADAVFVALRDAYDDARRQLQNLRQSAY